MCILKTIYQDTKFDFTFQWKLWFIDRSKEYHCKLQTLPCLILFWVSDYDRKLHQKCNTNTYFCWVVLDFFLVKIVVLPFKCSLLFVLCCCLFFFDLRILITPLVSSNSSVIIFLLILWRLRLIKIWHVRSLRRTH